MIFYKLPYWVLSGIIIFPVLMILGVIFFTITLGEFNILFWLIIPSIIFEELFETSYYAFSNSQVANLLFALIFWFIIGGTLGWITGKIKK
jgi:hypothetical protein